ncbi:MAG TPA: ATP-binding cassette domain-containing protein [Polyangiaceae bacterium]|nr:ATP-binding cassette domain-containing protein [Polyangiaceae bacterium]
MTSAGSLRIRATARLGRLTLDVALDCGGGPLVLIGPNGAGKSSLLSIVLGALPVEAGRIAIGEAVLLDTAQGIDVPIERRRIGYLPQDYALFPHLSVRENLEFALASAEPTLSSVQRRQRVDAHLDELGLGPYAHRSPRTLSGGEKQRVALARALSVAPRALLLDEPLAALDVHSRGEVRAFLAEYLERVALPTLVVTHDAADARHLARRIAVIEDGKIVQVGTWHELAANPQSRFVSEFVAAP